MQCVTQIWSLLLCKAHSPALTDKSASCGRSKTAALAAGEVLSECSQDTKGSNPPCSQQARESLVHRLSPTHNPSGTAELQNPPGTEEAVSSTNMISWGICMFSSHRSGKGELSWGTPLNWVISAPGPNRHKSCQPRPPMLMLPMPP